MIRLLTNTILQFLKKCFFNLGEVPENRQGAGEEEGEEEGEGEVGGGSEDEFLRVPERTALAIGRTKESSSGFFYCSC